MNSYLVAYDYGSGGLWAIINAPDRDAIENAFPKLTVLDEKPDSMTIADYAKLQAQETYDLAGPLPKWLAELDQLP